MSTEPEVPENDENEGNEGESDLKKLKTEDGLPLWTDEGDLKEGQARMQIVDLTRRKDKDKFKKIENYRGVHFEYNSKRDKHVYSGKLLLKRPSLGEMARIETEIARRNAGIDSNQPVTLINERLVTLATVVVEGPDWLRGLETDDDIHDFGLIARLWEVYQEFLSSFR